MKNEEDAHTRMSGTRPHEDKSRDRVANGETSIETTDDLPRYTQLLWSDSRGQRRRQARSACTRATSDAPRRTRDRGHRHCPVGAPGGDCAQVPANLMARSTSDQGLDHLRHERSPRRRASEGVTYMLCSGTSTVATGNDHAATSTFLSKAHRPSAATPSRSDRPMRPIQECSRRAMLVEPRGHQRAAGTACRYHDTTTGQ